MRVAGEMDADLRPARGHGLRRTPADEILLPLVGDRDRRADQGRISRRRAAQADKGQRHGLAVLSVGRAQIDGDQQRVVGGDRLGDRRDGPGIPWICALLGDGHADAGIALGSVCRQLLAGLARAVDIPVAPRRVDQLVGEADRARFGGWRGRRRLGALGVSGAAGKAGEQQAQALLHSSSPGIFVRAVNANRAGAEFHPEIGGHQGKRRAARRPVSANEPAGFRGV